MVVKSGDLRPGWICKGLEKRHFPGGPSLVGFGAS